MPAVLPSLPTRQRRVQAVISWKHVWNALLSISWIVNVPIALLIASQSPLVAKSHSVLPLGTVECSLWNINVSAVIWWWLLSKSFFWVVQVSHSDESQSLAITGMGSLTSATRLKCTFTRTLGDGQSGKYLDRRKKKTTFSMARMNLLF